MTRYFLRDKNGEESEIPNFSKYVIDDFDVYVSSREKKLLKIDAVRKEIFINEKLHFVVLQEI